MFGKVNFTNLSRYREWSEKTYRRHYSQAFSFMVLNAVLIEAAIPSSVTQIGAMDCSFIPKSGKTTYGLDWFYNGSASRSEKGLEISVIAVIDVAAHRGYSLSVQQTAAKLGVSQTKPKRKGIAWQTIEQVQTMLQPLPEKTKSAPSVTMIVPTVTRIDPYLQQLKNTRPYLPTTLKYWAVDGFYSKKKFVDGVLELDLHRLSKLRSDADMRYLYTGGTKTARCQTQIRR